MSIHPESSLPPSGRADPLLGLALHLGLSLQEPTAATNFIFSPVSIRLALSFLAAGAAGETMNQMLAFLGSPTLESLNSASGRLIGSVLANERVLTGHLPDVSVPPSSSGKRGRPWGPPPRLSLATGVWVDQSLTLKPSFQDVAASIYRAQSKSVDFQNQPREAASQVNAWVAKETEGLIRELLPHESIDPCTHLVLASALYFGAAWEEPFSQRRTQIGDFHLLDGTSVQTPFMSIPERQYVAVHDGFKVLKLPYHRGAGGAAPEAPHFSMCLFLPDELHALRALVERAAADPGFVDRHVPSCKVSMGKYRIPKFKFSFHFEASEALRGLGLELPFSPSDAELTEMVVLPSPWTGERLHVGKFHHSAAVEVGEEGTEAAAAVAGVLYRRSHQWQEPVVDFVADHPFLFVIREEESGEILFLGHVVDPSLRGGLKYKNG